MILFFYNLALLLALVVGAPWWLWRMATAAKYRQGLLERLGRVRELPGRDGRPTIWLHAVSVGEVLAVSGLVKELDAAVPGHFVAISTTTSTGQALARERFGDDRVFYCPLDLPWAVSAHLNALQPALLVLAETEFWPNLLASCFRREIPVVVVNARVSDRSWPRYRALGWFWKPLLSRLSAVLAQSETDAERLAAIGCRGEAVSVAGNLKFDVRATGEAEAARILKALRGGLRLVVAGSTLDGEETALLEAWPRLLQADPNLVLVLAPRHPERFGAVAEQVEATGYTWNRRTHWQQQPAGTIRLLKPGHIVLLDSIGELASVYSTAAVAFVGGSLVEAGGHNPLEPAQFGVPTVMGPHYANFRAIADDLRAHEGLRITEVNTLAEVLTELLLDRPAALALGEHARRAFERQAGATARCVEVILGLVNGAAEPEETRAKISAGVPELIDPTIKVQESVAAQEVQSDLPRAELQGDLARANIPAPARAVAMRMEPGPSKQPSIPQVPAGEMPVEPGLRDQPQTRVDQELPMIPTIAAPVESAAIPARLKPLRDPALSLPQASPVEARSSAELAIKAELLPELQVDLQEGPHAVAGVEAHPDFDGPAAELKQRPEFEPAAESEVPIASAIPQRKAQIPAALPIQPEPVATPGASPLAQPPIAQRQTLEPTLAATPAPPPVAEARSRQQYDRPGFTARKLLMPLTPAYRLGQWMSDRRIGSIANPVRKLRSPVVSIGNLSTGGAGKTPLAIALASALRKQGLHVNVLSRGYGRKAEFAVQVNPSGTAEEFGDEPLLIARRAGVPVYVAPERFDAGQLAEADAAAIAILGGVARPVVNLLDDGFQHRQLARDVDILLLDRADWEDALLPAGNLREPLSAIRRANVVAIPAWDAGLEDELRAWGWAGPVWRVERRMEPPALADSSTGPVLAFCGIARPAQFFAGLEAGGPRIAVRKAFPDHYAYKSADLEKLLAEARAKGAVAMVTTEKDLVRLGTLAAVFPSDLPLKTAELRSEIEDQAAALQWLLARIAPTFSGNPKQTARGG